MKKIIFVIAFLISSLGFSQNIEVLQINAKWNKKNDLTLNLKNCKYSYAFLEEQPQSVQKDIKSVPYLLIMKNGRPVRQYNGGLKMKLEIKEEELQQYINSLLDE